MTTVTNVAKLTLTAGIFIVKNLKSLHLGNTTVNQPNFSKNMLGCKFISQNCVSHVIQHVVMGIFFDHGKRHLNCRKLAKYIRTIEKTSHIASRDGAHFSQLQLAQVSLRFDDSIID